MEKIHYPKSDSGFFEELKERVNRYFQISGHTTRATRSFKIKILFLFLVYLGAYGLLYITNLDPAVALIIYGFLGAWSIVLGLNIGHDAAHGVIFRKKRHNQRLTWIFEIVGTSGYNWVNRHLGAHHVFPNVMDYDSDIQQTNMVKIFPEDKHRHIHRFQHLYMPLLYLIYIFRWVTYRDFKDAFSKRIGVFDNRNYPIVEIVKMIGFKALYIGYIVVLPAIYHQWSILFAVGAFFLLTVIGSLVITMVLLSTHVGEDANFPTPDENNMLPHAWAEHQVITAADFATKNKLVHFLFGGFNHHVVHHLFPNVCHCHYPALTPILQEVAQKYDLPYRSQKSVIGAMRSHFRLLKENARNGRFERLDHIFEH